MAFSFEELKSELQNLWYQLGGDPGKRALVVARSAATHGNKKLKQYFADLIAEATPASEQRDQALKLLIPTRLLLPTPYVANPTPIRVDPELGRLAIALYLASVFRIWVIARQLTRNAKGSGLVQRAEIRGSLPLYGVKMTREHFNRLLRSGDGIFWNINNDRIFIRSPRFVAWKIVRLAAAKNAELVATNRPGVRDVYLSTGGSHEAWEGMLYAGWMTHRENPTIARETLEMLFGRSADTLRRWEQTRLSDILTIRENYAQCHVPPGEWYDFIPEHNQAYVAEVKDQGKRIQIVRIYWRLPNTYFVTGIRQHSRRGQASKVRKIVNSEFDEPTTSRRGGLHRFKLYFDSGEQLRVFVGKHGGVRYLWRGENRHRRGIFEPNDNGFGVIRANERAKLKHEAAYFAEQRRKREAFLAQSA